MEITSKLLLKSAENFALKRKEASSVNERNSKITKNLGEDKENKIKKLYENLKEIQNQYSKEQARLEYLQNHSELIDRNLKFNSEVLFPEYDENWKPEEILNKTHKKLEELKYKLKQLEIEQENYFAANFASPSEWKIETQNMPFTKIHPERVNELTRNQFMA